MVRISSAASQANLLTRQPIAATESALSSNQAQIDAIQANFTHEASDVGNLLAMTTGAFAFRYARLGMQSLGMARSFANAGALALETTAFRSATHAVSRLRGEIPQESILDGRGWATTFLTLGSLKAAGAASQGQNALLGHALQSSAMVASHNFAYGLGIATQPQGSLVSQFAHAEATNIALGAGQSLFGLATGGAVARAESRLDAMSEAASLRAKARTARGSEAAPLPSMASRDLSTRATLPADWPASISHEWAEVSGSGLYTAREVGDTRALNEAIVHDGILKLLGTDAVHSVFAYGSYPYFRDGKAEDIRLWDADKKPDYIIVGNAQQMAENIARTWNLSPAQRAELQNHVRYNRNGVREGFAFFNTDILIPGRGPVGFKISIIDEAGFFAEGVNGRAELEYSQIRLKDATTRQVLWSRDAERTLGHLEKVRDEFFERAYARLRGVETTGADLARSFFIYSYRVEGYRFWENGNDSWDKGSKLYKERKDVSRPILLPAFQRFVGRHADHVRVYYQGRVIAPEQITEANMYDVTLVDANAGRGSFARRMAALPAYLWLNVRGLLSYLLHGVPSNRLSRAYYVQSSAEYAGRKGRNLVYKPGMSEADIPGIARLMAHPLFKKIPVLKKVALDSLYYPVYYSNLGPWINEGYRNGRFSQGEYDALMGWLSSSPLLTQQSNLGLVTRIDDQARTAASAELRSGAAKLLRGISELPLLEPEVTRFIQSRRLGSTAAP